MRRVPDEFYELLFQRSPIPMFTFHHGTFRMRDVNNAALTLYGYAREAFLARSMFDICVADELARLHLSHTDGEVWRHRRADGSQFPVELNWSAVGKDQACCVTVRDVSAIHQAARFAALGEMAGCIAHEINNPLAIILGSCEILRDTPARPYDTLEVDRMVERVHSTGSRIARTVQALRGIMRDGELDDPQDVAVASIVGDALELCRERFRHHGIALAVPAHDADARISARSTQVVQVLLNLLNNAFDAVRAEQTRWVKIEIVQLATSTEISVSDSGPGVPPELRERILTPYFTTKGVGEGTGLGLSISKTIVERHGGSFYLDTEAAHTRFVMRLPRPNSETEWLAHAA